MRLPCLLLCLTSFSSQAWQESAAQDSPPAPHTSNSAPANQTLNIKKTVTPAGWEIYQGEQLIGGYRSMSNGRPVVYPVIGPSGQEMTRSFPLAPAQSGETTDHDHHRSMWLTHGDVNGVDFWLDDEGSGTIVQRLGTATVQDNKAVIETENDWLSPQGKRLLSDARRFTFYEHAGRRIIDCDVLLVASDGTVNFGDTKEGTFGVRVAGTMKADAQPGGVITNAENATDGGAWGKRSRWVDYSGPVNTGINSPRSDSNIAGISIHNHPSSFGYPTRWHVRSYGLFAANPFGVHHFEGGPKRTGIVLEPGQKIHLSYRVVLHDGPLDRPTTKKDSKRFANETRPFAISKKH